MWKLSWNYFQDEVKISVINGEKDPCGFCKYENLAPATNYIVYISVKGVREKTEYGVKSENTIYQFKTNTTGKLIKLSKGWLIRELFYARIAPSNLPKSFFYIHTDKDGPSIIVIWSVSIEESTIFFYK